MKRSLLLGCALLMSSLLFGQQRETLEAIEIRAYVQQEQIPQSVPFNCPALSEQVEDDILASRVVSTILYELVNFWGNGAVEGTEGGYSDREAVFWKIVKSNGEDYEVILKTEGIRLGKKVYGQLEEQQNQSCFDWGLVFSNEEVVVLDEETTEDLVITEEFGAPTAYQEYDPYASESIRFNTQPSTPTSNYEDSYTLNQNTETNYELPLNTIQDNTTPNSYDGNTGYARQENEFNAAAQAFSAMMPASSAEITLPLDFFTSIETLGEVERRIVNALEARGYTNKGYFEFDNGFMIATQLEAVNGNGTSKADQYRWPSRITFNQSLSFTNYLSSLFLPERGKYRMFIFYVEAAPDRIYTDFDEIDYSVANSRSVNDSSRSPLPDQIARLPYRHKNGFDSNVKVLVYEAETGANERRPNLLPASSMSARDHLIKAGLWNLFNAR